MRTFIINTLSFFVFLILTSCNQEWLEVRKDQKLVIPNTLADYQALMDNIYVFNRGVESLLGELSSDDLYCLDSDWMVATDLHRYAYIWSPEVVDYYSQSTSNDWNNYYQKVFYTNVVLEGLNKDQQYNNANWRNTIGQAYFWRAWAFYHLAQQYCVPYEPSTINMEKGIPLPLVSDINIRYGRSSLLETYEQITSDVLQAISFLPAGINNINRPSLEAAYGLLSRVLLQKGDYDSLYDYTSQALELTKPLINYNLVNATVNYPFEEGNQEVILNTTMSYTSSGILIDGRMKIDTMLYESYDILDKRKSLFFKKSGNYNTFKGTYSGGIRLFSGLSVDELYMNYLESAARIGVLESDNTKLQEWIRNRYDPNYVFNFDSKQALLDFVLEERRKQLVFRGLRWQDIRRLNTLHKQNIKPIRKINNITYVLENSPRMYSFDIPKNVLVFNQLL